MSPPRAQGTEEIYKILLQRSKEKLKNYKKKNF